MRDEILPLLRNPNRFYRYRMITGKQPFSFGGSVFVGLKLPIATAQAIERYANDQSLGSRSEAYRLALDLGMRALGIITEKSPDMKKPAA